jgi:hypothetical protein
MKFTLEQRLAIALRWLHDFQNGAPLSRYEKEWNDCMRYCESLIKDAEKDPILIEAYRGPVFPWKDLIEP